MAGISSTDHPYHPATVHWPLAFLTASYGLDALHPILPSLPKILTNHLPASAELSRISYYALSVGLLTALPSIATGVPQMLKMIKSQGVYEQDGKTIKPKVKSVVVHALLNDIIVAGSAYSWWCRRQASSVGMLKEGLNPVAYEPARWMVALSVVFGGLILFAANIGGTLVYNYGMGVGIGKKGKFS